MDCICEKAYRNEHDRPDCPGVGQPIHDITMLVTESELRYLLITAVEGGINYWAQAKGGTYDPDKGVVTIREQEASDGSGKPGKWIRVTTATILGGLRLCAVKSPRTFARWLSDRTGDAGDADVIFQYAVLMAEVYG